jgi:TonB family protein
MPLNGRVQTVPMGLFPTYCFDSHEPTLRAYYSFGSTSMIYNKVVRMQGMFLARELAVFEGKRRILTASVDVIDALAATAPELTPAQGAVPINGQRKITVSSAVAQGQLIKQVRPVYPQDAKEARTQGRVQLQALIGTDGHIHELSVIDGPSPSLIGAAMWAVSQWEYKPYLLNGEPVTVDTTINVIFNMSN